ncbi:MAG TPA: response regulator transcription factor [Ktedonobacterales bacterium]|nr:response regulator transcription factor [Ktedonobacterales bacterium]
MAAILVVEDEIDLNNLLKTHLEGEGHSVYQAFNGPAALALADAHTPDLVILDWMLPGMDGLAVCRQLRQAHLMPVIMLTARDEEIDRVLGLEVGADDYVTKPFSMRELLARVRAMLRRVALDAQPGAPAALAGSSSPDAADPHPDDGMPPAPEPIVRGPLRVDLANHLVTLDGQELDLTPKEYDLLALLAGHPGRAFSREFLVERLWGYTYDGYDRTVDTHIVRLRKKLGPLGERIVTVWGVGYRFVP